MTTKLDIELETFNRNRTALLGQARGKFALIKGDRIVDLFESQQDAINRGYKEFGNEPFLVKQILEVDTLENFTSSNLAV